jgi:hypothetical protein
VVLLIECKRLQNKEWVLLPHGGNVHLTRHARALRVERQNGAVIRGFPRWSDEPCDPNMPEAMFCVMPKDQRDRSVERVAAELVCATEALEHEEREYLNRRGGDSRRLYFSAIVTTAQLSICYFDPSHASLANGMIPASSKFTPARAVRLTKDLSTREVTDVPESAYGHEAAALVKAKERTVFVVNAESLDGFLNAFTVDDRDKSPLGTPEE